MEIQSLGIHKSDTGVVTITSNEADLYARNMSGKLLNMSYSTICFSTSRRPLGYAKNLLKLKRLQKLAAETEENRKMHLN